jgi:hypothetical protein
MSRRQRAASDILDDAMEKYTMVAAEVDPHPQHGDRIDENHDYVDTSMRSRHIDPSMQYGWRQTLEEIYVYIPVRHSIVRKGVNVLVTEAQAPDKLQ